MHISTTLLTTLMLVASTSIGCATRYNIVSPQVTEINAQFAFPSGPPDRVIVRVDNDKDDWLHIKWDDAKIVGITGFAIPTLVKPGNAINSIPPRSSVEYHIYPDQAYLPASQINQRRDGFSTLLVYDSDYDRMAASSQSPTINLYVPVCKGSNCQEGSEADQGWIMSNLQGQVRRFR